MNLGRHSDSWRAFCEQAGVEFALIDTELAFERFGGRPAAQASTQGNGSPAHADAVAEGA